MQKKIFSLDIRDDHVVGVVLSQSHKVRIVSDCAVEFFDTGSFQEAVAKLVKRFDYQEGPCYVSFEAENFFFRNVRLPFSDRKKISKMLLYELEETAPTNIKHLVADCIIGRTDEKGTEVMAALCARSFLEEQIAFLKSVQVDPERISITTVHTVLNLISQPDTPDDFIFLDIGQKRATVVPVVAGEICFIRSLVFDPKALAGFEYDIVDKKITIARPGEVENVLKTFAVSINQTLLTLSSVVSDYRSLPFIIGGTGGMLDEIYLYFNKTLDLQCWRYNALQYPLLKVDPKVRDEWAYGVMDHALAQAIIASKDENSINFRKDDFAKIDSKRNIRKAVLWGGGSSSGCLCLYNCISLA